MGERKEIDLSQFRAEEKAVQIVSLVDFKPAFLDGAQVQYTTQIEMVSCIRDPTSDLAKLAKEGSKASIVQRYVPVHVECAGEPKLSKLVRLNLKPIYPPLDHTYRFFEPENSHFALKIPPFIPATEDGIEARCSDPFCDVKLDK